jgi:hypothetical protein
MDMADDTEEDIAKDTAEAADPERSRRRRARWATVLVVVGAILLPIAGLSFWARNMVLDTDRYLDTVEPLASDPAVQAAMADRLSEVVVDVTDIQARAAAALPERAAFLAAPIAAGMERVVNDLAAQLLASDQFEQLWVEANRVAHNQIVDILEGKSTEGIERDDGQVVVLLGPLAERLLDRVSQVVPIDLSNIDAERLNVRFVLIDSDDLAKVQSLVEWANRLTYLLIALAVASFVAAVFVAPDRRAGLQRVGIGIAASMSVTLLAYAFARDRYLTNLPDEVEHPDAAEAIFDTLTRYVQQGLRAFLALGVVLWIGAWAAGPSSSAAWVRARWNALTGHRGEGVAQSGGAAWVAGHATELRAAIAAVGVLALLLWDRPTGKVVVLLAILVALGFAAVQLVGGAKPPVATPDTK